MICIRYIGYDGGGGGGGVGSGMGLWPYVGNFPELKRGQVNMTSY